MSRIITTLARMLNRLLAWHDARECPEGHRVDRPDLERCPECGRRMDGGAT